ncbi:MAG TPA: hypothetical protein VLT87_09905 [Thermoanaerobaculia bacterium]|nr:hypothetical protein [Thermoanaerobaculia bacterium]
MNILPMEMFKDGSGAEFTGVGVMVYYDESGRCAKIEARVFGDSTAQFMLVGHPVNNVSEEDAEALFRSLSPEIRPSSGGFDLPAAGLQAFKWEASDDFLYSIFVKPPEDRTAQAAATAPPPEPAEPEPPARVLLELGDQQVVFVRTGADGYAAELDGKRQPIRITQQLSDVSEGGYRHQYKPTQSEGETANIDHLLHCLALGASRTPLVRGLELSAIDQWGHFRQKTFLKVSITITEDGVVEIDEDIQVQDDSYY